MRIVLDEELQELKKMSFEMSGLVEKGILEVQSIFENHDLSGVERVFQFEDKVNERHIAVDLLSMKILARLSPVAHDLRLIIAITKINQDLERMGDQVRSLALAARDLIERGSKMNSIHLQRMFQSSYEMVRKSITCLINEDPLRAEQLLVDDDILDQLKRLLIKEMTQKIKDGEEVEAALDFMQVARSLERIGDHATNIAENVIFLSTGRDVRHGGKFT